MQPAAARQTLSRIADAHHGWRREAELHGVPRDDAERLHAVIRQTSRALVEV